MMKKMYDDQPPMSTGQKIWMLIVGLACAAFMWFAREQ